jgi:5'-methylthioadenosine phosphorylase
MTIAILGASKYAAAVEDREIDVVVTAFGDQAYEKGTINGIPVIWIRRFGWGDNLPSHVVNHQAHIAALSALGIKRAFTLNGFGGVNQEMAVGDLAIPHDTIKFLHREPPSILPALGWPRADLGPEVGGPYCPEIRQSLASAAKQASKRRVWERAVNLCAQGPSLEGEAEIEAFRRLGADLVSTTIYPELIYARELGICFASFCWVSNHPGRPAQNWQMFPTEEVVEILRLGVKHIPPEPQSCKCQDFAKGHR